MVVATVAGLNEENFGFISVRNLHINSINNSQLSNYTVLQLGTRVREQNIKAPHGQSAESKSSFIWLCQHPLLFMGISLLFSHLLLCSICTTVIVLSKVQHSRNKPRCTPCWWPCLKEEMFLPLSVELTFLHTFTSTYCLPLPPSMIWTEITKLISNFLSLCAYN